MQYFFIMLEWWPSFDMHVQHWEPPVKD